MDKNEVKELVKEISNIKRLNIGQNLSMKKYYLKTFLYSLIVFGYNSNITQEVFKVYDEYTSIKQKEKRLLTFLKKNLDKIDYKEACNFLDEIDDLNEKIITYLIEQFDNIEEACDLKNENRCVRDKRNFPILTDGKRYDIMLQSLIINFDDIKEFLGYEDYFWNDILDKIEFVDDSYKGSYGLFFLEEDVKIILPKIVNLETSIICINNLSLIYNKYYSTNPKGKDLESEFKNTYLVKKIDKKETSVPNIN